MVFWQEELFAFDDHFFWQKFDQWRIEPEAPDALRDYYIEQFDEADPFTEDSLIYLGTLARGIWRWFKKYIKECLLYYRHNFDPNSDSNTITTEKAKQIITFDRLEQDWSRELSRMFPKARHYRRKAVRVISHLQEHGATKQSDIQRLLLDDNKMLTSRLLSVLEEYEYVDRTFEGKEKIVSLRR